MARFDTALVDNIAVPKREVFAGAGAVLGMFLKHLADDKVQWSCNFAGWSLRHGFSSSVAGLYSERDGHHDSCHIDIYLDQADLSAIPLCICCGCSEVLLRRDKSRLAAQYL